MKHTTEYKLILALILAALLLTAILSHTPVQASDPFYSPCCPTPTNAPPLATPPADDKYEPTPVNSPPLAPPFDDKYEPWRDWPPVWWSQLLAILERYFGK